MAKKSARKPKTGKDSPIINSPIRERNWDAITRKQVPREVAANLAGALNGNLHLQTKLWWAMVDTWPRLQTNIGDMQDAVAGAEFKIEPFTEDCECEAKPEAVERAAFVADAFAAMKGDRFKNELSFEDLLRGLVFGFYASPYVAEIYWGTDEKGTRPRAAKSISPRFYGYPTSGNVESDELRLFPKGFALGAGEDFPEHKFVVASRLSYPGHPAIASPMRVLCAYWAAATYGIEWLMSYAQLYGVPFRWAEVADGNTAAVDAMLASMGSTGHAAVPSGTKINFEHAVASAASLPQTAMIELADKKCDLWVKGETLTSDEGKSGSRSLGEVQERTKGKKQQSVANFVAEIVTNQAIPSVVGLNFGDPVELPTASLTFPDPAGEKAAADKVKSARNIGLPMAKDYVYEQLGIPIPQKDDELFEPEEREQPPMPRQPGVKPPSAPPKPGAKPAKAQAARANTGSRIDQLVDNTLQAATGLQARWLEGIRPVFERLIAKAEDGNVSDEDFHAALVTASRQMPEHFDKLDTEALQQAYEQAQMSAVVTGAEDQLRAFDA